MASLVSRFFLATVILPHSCSFEDRAICDYSQSRTDTADWERNSGGTITVNTGPTSAFDGQQYMYLESSYPQTDGDFAVWVNALAQNRSRYMYVMFVSLMLDTYSHIHEMQLSLASF